jgi:hypothetical protein
MQLVEWNVLLFNNSKSTWCIPRINDLPAKLLLFHAISMGWSSFFVFAWLLMAAQKG